MVPLKANKEAVTETKKHALNIWIITETSISTVPNNKKIILEHVHISVH